MTVTSKTGACLADVSQARRRSLTRQGEVKHYHETVIHLNINRVSRDRTDVLSNLCGGFIFHDEAPFKTEVTSLSLQKFEFGSKSDYLSCKKLELETALPSEKELALAIKKYRECKYDHSGGTPEAAEEKVNSCAYELKSTLLKESPPKYFTGGKLKLECSPTEPELGFTTANCTIEIPSQGLSEFIWENQNIMTGKYKSELTFKLKDLAYELFGASCETNGFNGEYEGPVVLPEIIVEA